MSAFCRHLSFPFADSIPNRFSPRQSQSPIGNWQHWNWQHSHELVAKPDVARAPSSLQQCRGGLATSYTHGFATASHIGNTSTLPGGASRPRRAAVCLHKSHGITSRATVSMPLHQRGQQLCPPADMTSLRTAAQIRAFASSQSNGTNILGMGIVSASTK